MGLSANSPKINPTDVCAICHEQPVAHVCKCCTDEVCENCTSPHNPNLCKSCAEELMNERDR